MGRLQFPVTLVPASDYEASDTGYIVQFPDIPEAITQGEDEADALRNAIDCLEEALAYRLRQGEPIPVPSDGAVRVEPGSQIAARAALAVAMADANVSEQELAARLSWDVRDIRRLLNPTAAMKLSKIERALGALGMRLTADMKSAA